MRLQQTWHVSTGGSRLVTVTAATRTNWAGNVTYRASELVSPTSVDEVRRIVAGTPRLTALGSTHSFNRIADTDAVQVSLAGLPPQLEIDTDRRVVRVAAGMIHSQVAAGLEARGWALANLASLPHISTAGAVATGTHGSGIRNPSLAQAVVGLEVVRPPGTWRGSMRPCRTVPSTRTGWRSARSASSPRSSSPSSPRSRSPRPCTSTCRGTPSSRTSTRSWPTRTRCRCSRRSTTAAHARSG
ncbi:FAD-binding protein [Curtobacterium flaccumfaciens]|nr:FAD-binding protein [Curtobacterium flaccumfaciens]